MIKKNIAVIVVSFVVTMTWLNKDFFTLKVSNLNFIDIDNQPHQLFNGAPVLVNMWTSDCVACEKEMSVLKALYERYSAQGFRVIAVALSYDKLEAVKTYTEQKELNFPVIYDKDGDIAPHFGEIRVTPTSFLLDAQGGILKKSIGEPEWKSWEAEIEKQLKF